MHGVTADAGVEGEKPGGHSGVDAAKVRPPRFSSPSWPLRVSKTIRPLGDAAELPGGVSRPCGGADQRRPQPSVMIAWNSHAFGRADQVQPEPPDEM